MPADRKYSRSRSPVNDRSNRYKHHIEDRDRSNPTHGRSERPQDHRRSEREDGRRPREGDPRRDRYRDRDRDRGSDRRGRRDLDQETRRSRDRSTADHRNSRRTEQLEPKAQHGELRIRTDDKLDRDFGRLKSSSEELPLTRTLEHDAPRKRKIDELTELSAVAPSEAPRRSRFDKTAAPTNTDESPVGERPLTRSSKNDIAGSPSVIRLEVTRNQSTSDGLGNTRTDEQKLRERQERIAIWKKKKAEEAAQQESEADRPLKPKQSSTTQEITHVSPKIGPEAGSQPSAKSDGRRAVSEPVSQATTNLSSQASRLDSRLSSGLGKFDMSTKSNIVPKSSSARKTLGFTEEEGLERVLPTIVNDHGENPTAQHIDSHNDSLREAMLKKSNAATNVVENGSDDDEDDVDPLDAFMAENAAVLTTVERGSRLAGEVMNDQESDVEEERVEEDILAMVAKRIAQKKKDIVGIDHSKQNYEDFRKDFYVEPEELSGLSEAEVDAMRLELDGIVIRGKDCPKPMLNWGQCGMSADTLDQIQRLGYENPTSIQSQAIPAIMSGRDTIGVAKTGSGKTMAFLLPMFRHIKDQRPLEMMEGPIAMILTPTRELAVQIHKECKPFLKVLNLRAVCVYGGPPIKDQIAEFKRGAEIVVCTPGRMIDILAANQGRVTNLRRITYTVLDEADRMFDLGFEPQVMKIINNIRPQRQTVLFSATFPKSMEALARKILRGKPVEITVGARSVVAPEITQKIEIRPKDPDSLKFNRVLEILGDLYNTDEDARTLIFVDRQEAADSLLSQLMRKGYPCNALHGGKDQYDRDSTISDFKAGIFPIMVATSVAARGLDVKQLKLVINYDCPNHMEDYVHRVGRTGRAGNKGTAITFISEDQERYAFDIAKALRLSQVDIPAPLQVLADAFAAKVKSGLEKSSAAGFGGKGLAKFDTARDNEKRVQRKIYGEDDEADDDKDKILENESDNDDQETDRVNPEEVKAVAELGTSANADAPIRVERVTAQMKQTTMSKPNVGTKALDPVAAARARIDAINNRIKTGSKPMEQVASNPDAGEYRAMMEINDYPQKARWNVTNRTNIAKVLEATGTSITTQGQYVKPGSTAPAGVPKLYLLVEGPTELCVTDAVKELRRLLAEGTMADADASSTRYKVV